MDLKCLDFSSSNISIIKFTFGFHYSLNIIKQMDDRFQNGRHLNGFLGCSFLIVSFGINYLLTVTSFDNLKIMLSTFI